MIQAKTLAWSNPAQNTDGTAYDPATSQAGISIVLDGAPALSVPSGGAAFVDLTTIAAFQALKPGNHTVAIDVVTKTGVHSALTAALTFPIDAVPSIPNAPTGLNIK